MSDISDNPDSDTRGEQEDYVILRDPGTGPPGGGSPPPIIPEELRGRLDPEPSQ